MSSRYLAKRINRSLREKQNKATPSFREKKDKKITRKRWERQSRSNFCCCSFVRNGADFRLSYRVWVTSTGPGTSRNWDQHGGGHLKEEGKPSVGCFIPSFFCFFFVTSTTNTNASLCFFLSLRSMTSIGHWTCCPTWQHLLVAGQHTHTHT